ncbi:MAG: antiporter, family [Myxococcales bacterium]|nr:antiporter, family [Myxococcales bacterium]
MARWIARFFDLREGEARPVVQSFLVLFLLIGAHTTLETARDALFLTKLPPKELNLVYIALAGLSFVVAALSTRLALRFGRRNALIGTLGVAAVTTVLLHSMTPTPRVVMALYVFSGLVGAVLSPQFWLLAAQMFTSAQGRRLFGPIASGGVVGGVVGAGTAAVLLTYHSVASLLLVAAFAFIGTALLLTTLALPGDDDELSTRFDLADKAPAAAPSLALSQQPFVWRVALLVGLSTAAVLTVDFLFKSTAAASIPPARLGEFFARYYAVMNGVSLVVQLLVAGRIVRRLGVAGATGVMPSLLVLGGIASFLTGGALLPVLAMRMVDGGLRYSLNRVATELLYLPMPTKVRERAKGLIDTVLSRSVQAVTAAVLFGLGSAGLLSPRALAGIVFALCLSWTAVAGSLRRPYLDLFRRALSRGTLDLGVENTEIDVNAAEALVEAMASPEPVVVIAALDVLEQRNRGKLIPALILYHDAESVLYRALDIFGTSDRSDWVPLGERLLSHPSEGIRIAAVRALAKHGVASALVRTTNDASATVQAYAAFHLALADEDQDLVTHPRLAPILGERGEAGDAKRAVLLVAIADAADPRATSLVLAIAHSPKFTHSEKNMTLLARAMKALHDPRYIPFCVALLAKRPAREAIRQALVAMGDEALAALEAAATDPATERRVRTHVPRTIADFRTQRAYDFLMTRLHEERDGLVRYKVLRGLGHVVASSDVKVDRRRVEKEARRNLVEYLRLTALRVAMESESAANQGPEDHSPLEQLLVILLTDKQAQALERAFRLLKIAHRREDIHRVHTAARSNDRRARSNAGEFLDTLLSGAGQRELRELFRLVVDDLEPVVRVRRAAPWLGSYPNDRKSALAALREDRDLGLALLSRYQLDLPLEAVAS